MTGSTECSLECPNITFVDSQPEASSSGGKWARGRAVMCAVGERERERE